MIRRFVTVAQNTLIETIRQPVYAVILLVTAMLFILNVSLAAFTLDDDDKLLLDLGLNTLLLSGLFLAAFSASGVISRELDNMTALMVLSKPIGRPAFIVAKFMGIAAAMALASYLNVLLFVLTQRHGVLQRTSDPWDGPVLILGTGSVLISLMVGAFRNYFRGAHFSTTTIATATVLLTGSVLAVGKLDKDWDVVPFASHFVGGQVLIAALLVFLMVLVITAIAVAASTRLSQTMTLMVCLFSVAVGIISDYTFGRFAETSLIARVVHGLAPNFGPFWVVDGLMADSAQTTMTSEYVGYVTLYALVLTCAALAAAVAAFQRREVG